MGHVPRIYHSGRVVAGPLALPPEVSGRLASVMRVREGDAILLFSGDGREFHATITGTGKASVWVEVGELARQAPPPAVTLETWCPLIRPNRFDWMLEKCVEAGADVVRPLTSAHSARGDDASSARRERWRRIVVEAAEQSGRLYVPVVEPPAGLETLLARGRTALIFADATGQGAADLRPVLPVSGHLALAVGPEGGWSEDELRRARGAGALFLRLGPNILRAETAAVVGTAVLAELLTEGAARKPGIG